MDWSREMWMMLPRVLHSSAFLNVASASFVPGERETSTGGTGLHAFHVTATTRIDCVSILLIPKSYRRDFHYKPGRNPTLHPPCATIAPLAPRSSSSSWRQHHVSTTPITHPVDFRRVAG